MEQPSNQFVDRFTLLTGHPPFPWQGRLYEELLSGRFPDCDVPTGLGKTAVIAIWLLALAQRAELGSAVGFPRRLVYVVNRRTVVDQSTRVTEQLRAALTSKLELLPVRRALCRLQAGDAEVPLAVSTLRGQFADNAEWRDDPARPAVVVGTVDMIGSRLLFSGYGCGFKSRPLHAGFLGQDALLVHDEAHLEPAFQHLLEAVQAEQAQCGDLRPLRVMALSATRRAGGAPAHGIDDADRADPVAKRRIQAAKWLQLHLVEAEKAVPKRIAELAGQYKDSGQAILVFSRTLDALDEIARLLEKEKLSVQKLTGTLRGLERDRLATEDAIFARFLVGSTATPQQGTVYLLCTSAGEVGVDLSADHLVCDLTPFDSMAQRLGRVNRRGEGDARVDVVHELGQPLVEQEEVASDELADEVEPAAMEEALEQDAAGDEEDAGRKPVKGDALLLPTRQRTLQLLRQLPCQADGLFDASPGALGGLDPLARLAAFTPAPRILPVSDILFDRWAMTTVRGLLPGRPPVADWLHGVAGWDPPETLVAWRAEVDLPEQVLAASSPEELLADWPLKPHELIRHRTDRVRKALSALAQKQPAAVVWVIKNDQVSRCTLGTLDEGKPDPLAQATLLLSPACGGLRAGSVDGTAGPENTIPYDVADLARGPAGLLRQRIWDDEPPPAGMRLVRTIDTRPEATDEDGEDLPHRFWRWYAAPRAAEDDGSRTALQPQELPPHLLTTGDWASNLVRRLGLDPQVAQAVGFAARHHDRGKSRQVWQRAVGNRNYPESVLAKSDGKGRMLATGHYRHEVGSLVDVARSPELQQLAPEAQELALHLIATHHGRARPHFPREEAFDPERSDELVQRVLLAVPRRFALLGRRYGRWGLAYLESLVRAADAWASARGGQLPAPGSTAPAEQPEVQP